MPWTEKDASKHTKSARTPKQKRQWRSIANSVLERTGNEGRAIASANAVVGRSDRAKYGLDSVSRR